MNLLFVVPTFRKWGGAQEVIVTLVQHFQRRGHRIFVASEDTRETLQGRFSPETVHYPLPLKRRAPWTVAINFLKLLRVAQRERIDLISSHEKKTSALCLPIGCVLGIPVVHTAHTQMTNWRARLFGHLGHNLVANSVSTGEHLVRVFGARREDITVIEDAPQWMPVPTAADIERVREEFGVVAGQPVLVCLGRLTEEKGHEVLLEALVQVRRHFPDVRLLIVGKGHVRGRLEERARALGLVNATTFTGYRDDANAILCAATVAVCPSVIDMLPFVIPQCLCFRIPVIATSVGEIPGVIRASETGFLVQPNDPAALAQAICTAFRDPDGARALAERGRTEVLSRFEPGLMCEQYEAYFASVLHCEPPRELRTAREYWGTGKSQCGDKTER
ncbi:MAG: glycosyltransferase family 4 protein [Candidatus Binatia bacterium]